MQDKMAKHLLEQEDKIMPDKEQNLDFKKKTHLKNSQNATPTSSTEQVDLNLKKELHILRMQAEMAERLLGQEEKIMSDKKNTEK